MNYWSSSSRQAWRDRPRYAHPLEWSKAQAYCPRSWRKQTYKTAVGTNLHPRLPRSAGGFDDEYPADTGSAWAECNMLEPIFHELFIPHSPLTKLGSLGWKTVPTAVLPVAIFRYRGHRASAWLLPKGGRTSVFLNKLPVQLNLQQCLHMRSMWVHLEMRSISEVQMKDRLGPYAARPTGRSSWRFS